MSTFISGLWASISWHASIPDPSGRRISMITTLLVGTVTHYFSRLGVAALNLEGPLRKGDQIRILGATTELEGTVQSMEIEPRQVEAAGPGDDVAIRVTGKVRGGDRVFRQTEQSS